MNGLTRFLLSLFTI